jgi:hypothetical protein
LLRIKEDLDESVLEHVDGNPAISTRQLVAKFLVGHVIVWRVLHEHLLYPYHLQCVKVKVKFTLEQTTKSQKGSRRIDLLFL